MSPAAQKTASPSEKKRASRTKMPTKWPRVLPMADCDVAKIMKLSVDRLNLSEEISELIRQSGTKTLGSLIAKMQSPLLRSPETSDWELSEQLTTAQKYEISLALRAMDYLYVDLHLQIGATYGYWTELVLPRVLATLPVKKQAFFQDHTPREHREILSVIGYSFAFPAKFNSIVPDKEHLRVLILHFQMMYPKKIICKNLNIKESYFDTIVNSYCEKMGTLCLRHLQKLRDEDKQTTKKLGRPQKLWFYALLRDLYPDVFTDDFLQTWRPALGLKAHEKTVVNLIKAASITVPGSCYGDVLILQYRGSGVNRMSAAEACDLPIWDFDRVDAELRSKLQLPRVRDAMLNGLPSGTAYVRQQSEKDCQKFLSNLLSVNTGELLDHITWFSVGMDPESIRYLVSNCVTMSPADLSGLIIPEPTMKEDILSCMGEEEFILLRAYYGSIGLLPCLDLLATQRVSMYSSGFVFTMLFTLFSQTGKMDTFGVFFREYNPDTGPDALAHVTALIMGWDEDSPRHLSDEEIKLLVAMTYYRLTNSALVALTGLSQAKIEQTLMDISNWLAEVLTPFLPKKTPSAPKFRSTQSRDAFSSPFANQNRPRNRFSS